MKVREQRRKVMFKARMRTGASWHDVCVLNLSSRGLGVQAADPPPRGSYVEVRRGQQVVVARVVWAKGHRAGLQAQDPIWIEALIQESAAAPQRGPAFQGLAPVERRRAPRTSQQRHESSRLAARAMEFALIAIGGVGIAMIAAGTVHQAIAQPLSEIRAALGDGSP